MSRARVGPEAAGRGVWQVPHPYPDGSRLLYCTNGQGCIVGERIVSPEFVPLATVELEELLDRVDPVAPVQPRPALGLVR